MCVYSTYQNTWVFNKHFLLSPVHLVSKHLLSTHCMLFTCTGDLGCTDRCPGCIGEVLKLDALRGGHSKCHGSGHLFYDCQVLYMWISVHPPTALRYRFCNPHWGSEKWISNLPILSRTCRYVPAKQWSQALNHWLTPFKGSLGNIWRIS